MKKFLSILVWSVISAAFIGPGTVTTAAAAGARFNLTLLWALLFSTIATLVLQEASARITVASGLNLGQAIRQRFSGGTLGVLILLLVLGAIVLGCAAYEAGNILGGVAGAVLGIDMSAKWVTLAIGLCAGALLWMGTIRVVSYVLSSIVALMGIGFLMTAVFLKPDVPVLMKGLLYPTAPSGSGLLILGLIGTTVVPYNLFLGSGLAKGQDIQDMRFGLTFSILMGGIISMGVLVVGSAVSVSFSFQALAETLRTKIGFWAGGLFALGLFSAGFSSAVTAPLAAAVTAKSLFEKSGKNHWNENSLRYRSVWGGVLLIGLLFGLTDIRPIPAIILAQALNGIVLPFVAIFLLLVVNDRQLLGKTHVNGMLSNSLMLLIVLVTIILGMSNILKAGALMLRLPIPGENLILSLSSVLAIFIFLVLAKIHFKKR